MMVGRRLAELYPRVPHEPGEVALRVEDVAGTQAPASASFEVHGGEILGIAGLVGAGRTECLRAIFGLDPVRSGTVEAGGGGSDARPTPRARLAQGVGLLSRGPQGRRAGARDCPSE